MSSQKLRDIQATRTALNGKRENFVAQWKGISRAMDPTRGLFPGDQPRQNKGKKQLQHIINNTVLQAIRTSSSGMFNGIMRPNSVWSRLESVERSLMRLGRPRTYVDGIDELLRSLWGQSNLYTQAQIFLTELIMYATAAMSHVMDSNGVMRFNTYTIGSYMIAQNEYGEVNVFTSTHTMTVRQIMSRFDDKNIPSKIKRQAQEGRWEHEHTVIWFVEPNEKYIEGNRLSRFKQFKGYWFLEHNGGDGEPTFLREDGFDDFPVYVVRWQITANDVYGTMCPGMIALGDTNSLQVQEKEKAVAVAKMVSPLLKGPPELKDAAKDVQAKGAIVLNGRGIESITPVYQVDPRIQELRADMQDTERRIQQAFFVDLFLAISNMQGIQPRNELEISSRNDEALLVLGPVLDRIQREFLQRLVENSIRMADREGLLPDPPPELEGQALEVKFVSPLAQAQQSSELRTTERFLNNIITLAVNTQRMDVLDKVNLDAAVDQQALNLGVDASLLVDPEQVQQIRQQRQQQLQRAQEIEDEQKRATANAQNATADRQRSDS